MTKMIHKNNVLKLKKISMFLIILALSIVEILFLGCSKPSEIDDIETQQIYLDNLKKESKVLGEMNEKSCKHVVDFINGKITKKNYQEKMATSQNETLEQMNFINGLIEKLAHINNYSNYEKIESINSDL